MNQATPQKKRLKNTEPVEPASKIGEPTNPPEFLSSSPGRLP